MTPFLRKVLCGALLALSVGLCIDIYGISTTDLTALQAIGMVGVFLSIVLL